MAHHDLEEFFLSTRVIEVEFDRQSEGNIITVTNMDRGMDEPFSFQLREWPVSSLLRRLKEGGVNTIDEAILVMNALNSQADYNTACKERNEANLEAAKLTGQLEAANETKKYLMEEVRKLREQLEKEA